MRQPTVLSVGAWAHHSWLMRTAPVRGERALNAASAQLLTRYPQLAQLDFAQLPPYLGRLPRSVCARLFRVSAALACAPALRRMVTASAHLAFARNVAPQMLRAIQQHPRGARDDLELDFTLDLFDRREMTAAGLALSLRGFADSGQMQHTWLKLRMPREIASRAARYRFDELASDSAHALVDDAWRLMRGAAARGAAVQTEAMHGEAAQTGTAHSEAAHSETLRGEAC
jgi:hypothetical protein